MENGTSLASFIYDADGGRVKKITMDGATLYIGKLFEQRPDGSMVDHVFAGDQQICDIIQTGGVSQPFFIHADHLGSASHWSPIQPTALTQSEENQYAPFGDIIAEKRVDSTGSYQKYTGQENDDVRRDYIFYNARYYDPVMAR